MDDRVVVENVSKSFGPVHAVRDLTLRIPAGELFCFLGPNGAGKTTTLKLVAGLVRPDRGQIRIGGMDIQRDPVGAKQLMGYIPDTPFLYERLTPLEFLRFTADLYGMPEGRLGAALPEMIERFGLGPYLEVLVGDLSHGMRQRLLYVATLLHEPQVLLIDEPFVGLDPYTIRMIKDLLRAKARGGMTVFFTTHILAVAEEIADRIGIILDGRLVALGRLEELAAQSGVGGHLEDVFLKLTGAPVDAPAA
jgi:ABC-2 type transport system ATP-binding protein